MNGRPKLDDWEPRDEYIRDRELPIWLVWTLADNGNVTLRAITFRQSRANNYRKYALRDGAIRAYIEKSTANHLYAGVFDVFSAVARARMGRTTNQENERAGGDDG